MKPWDLTKTAKKCFTYNYNTQTDKNNKTSMKPNADGFVACSTSVGKNECQYETSLNKTITKNCECGYNSAGQGYCPIDHEHGEKKIRPFGC